MGQSSSWDTHFPLLFSPAGPVSSGSSSGVKVKGTGLGCQDACETYQSVAKKPNLACESGKESAAETWLPGEGRASIIFCHVKTTRLGTAATGLGGYFAPLEVLLLLLIEVELRAPSGKG